MRMAICYSTLLEYKIGQKGMNCVEWLVVCEPGSYFFLAVQNSGPAQLFDVVQSHRPLVH